jgi:hypothetical protein
MRTALLEENFGGGPPGPIRTIALLTAALAFLVAGLVLAAYAAG